MNKNTKRYVVFVLPVAVALVSAGIIIYLTIMWAGQGAALPDHLPATELAAQEGEAEALDARAAADDMVTESAAQGRMTGRPDAAIQMVAGAAGGMDEQMREDIEREMMASQDNDTFEAPACEFGHWVGGPVPEDELEALGRPYRVLTPGAMATMDYLPERINVYTDDEGTVLRVDCG